MTRATRRAIPEDVYGPSYDLILVGTSIAIALLFAIELLTTIFNGLGTAPRILFAILTALPGAYAVRAILRRRMLRGVFLRGEAVQAHVVQKQEEILGTPFGGGNVRYWLTLRYELGGAQTARRRVTDRVYLRVREGEEMTVRVLRDRPDLWVPVVD
jgi:hypothetical protein